MLQLAIIMTDLKEGFRIQKVRFDKIYQGFDRDSKLKELRNLEAKSLKSDFWEDIKTATEIMQQISDLKAEIKELTDLDEEVTTLEELVNLNSDEAKGLDVNGELEKFKGKLDELELKFFLSERYDHSDCFLSIHAGQGGVEAMDWAAMLARMYQRYAEKKSWKVTLVDETKGEEAGIKSITLEIRGPLAYGFLKRESGTHRLVRLSPFNADNLRQTSFALVEVLPMIDDKKTLAINDSDLAWDTFRSSGPGGQNVQKVSTAVRLKHLPTNIVVTCQSERSQFQNKENALKILLAKLFQRQEEKRLEEEKNLKDWQKTASWGSQIRSYVLHPYKMVKDLRTNVEATNAEEVLDGNLDQFIAAEIKL